MTEHEIRLHYWKQLEQKGLGKFFDGQFYTKAHKDPIVELLHEELQKPCHNCQCYKAELADLKLIIENLQQGQKK